MKIDRTDPTEAYTTDDKPYMLAYGTAEDTVALPYSRVKTISLGTGESSLGTGESRITNRNRQPSIALRSESSQTLPSIRPVSHAAKVRREGIPELSPVETTAPDPVKAEVTGKQQESTTGREDQNAVALKEVVDQVHTTAEPENSIGTPFQSVPADSLRLGDRASRPGDQASRCRRPVSRKPSRCSNFREPPFPAPSSGRRSR